VTGFAATAGTNEGEIKLTWLAPGDDGWTDPLPSGSEFRIQHSTWTGVSWSKDSAQVIVLTSGVTPMTSVSYVATGLQSGTTYYFRIWHADEVPNWSDLSNGATAQAGLLSTDITEVSFNFGQIFPGGSVVSSSSATVKNNGSINATYQIKLSTPPSWNAGTAPDTDQFVFYVRFNSVLPSAGDFGAEDILSTTTVSCTASVFAGDETGVNVPAGEKRSLWAYFKAPTATTVETQQGIVVTITPIKP